MTDSEECDSHGTNPNAWATAGAIWPWMPEGTVASNWPGSDSYFVSHQLNPTNVAMTTNGFPALWEELLDGAGSLAPGVDTDGDGVSNADEVRQNSNPRDPDDSEPKPFVIRFEPTRPDWVNACVSNDIGFGGKVRVCFQGAKAGQGICIRVREGGRQFEAFTLRWQKAVQTACLQRGTDTVWYTSARLSENSALVVKDARTHPEYTNALGGEYTITNFTVRLVPDWDRNRIINSHDAAAMQKGEPFRFWINNDNDDGPVGDDKSDIPCYWTRWFGRADCNNDAVDGECDLLDFFPVWIDAADLLANLPEEGVTCRLRQDDKAVNAVYTGLGNANAGSFLTGTNAVYGPGFDQPPQRAPVFPVTKAGVELSEDFISWNTTNTSTPILLLEGRAKTEKPLVLEVLLDGKLVFPAEMPLSIESVGNMYRWINLRPSGPPRRDWASRPTIPTTFATGKTCFSCMDSTSTRTKHAPGAPRCSSGCTNPVPVRDSGE